MSGNKEKPKYYAVRNGRKNGIFLDWLTTCRSVNRFKSCNHQGFQTLNEAADYLRCAELYDIQVHTNEGSIPLDDFVKQNVLSEDSDTTALKKRIKSIQKEVVENKHQDEHLNEETSIIDQCLICQKIAGKYFLKCADCNFKIHYTCSELPSYQITNFVTSNRRFTCDFCTIVMPEVEAATVVIHSDTENLENSNDHTGKFKYWHRILDGTSNKR